MIRVDALLFDLDGTLVDSKRDLADSVNFLQRRYNVRPSSVKQIGGFIGDGVAKLVQRAMPELPDSQLDEAIIDFKKYYRDHCLRHTRAYAGVREMLSHFQHKKMAVVTNKPVRISAYMLDELNLSRYFKVLIGGDSLPKKKPHPEPVLSALKTMRHDNLKTAIMIGDSRNDIEAGQSAGIRTCGVKSNIGDLKKLVSSRPDFLIVRMNELTRLFA